MNLTAQSEFIAAAAALLGVLLGAVPAYLVAHAQHRMALERLYADKWWDKKDQAYAEIVSSLTSLMYSLERRLDAQVRHVTSEEYLGPIREEHKRAKQRVQMAAIRGSYAVSQRTADALSRLIKELEETEQQNTTRFEVLDEHWAASKACLKIVRAEAESDLRTSVE